MERGIENPSRIHKLKGKKGTESNKGKPSVEMYDSLAQFFENFKEEAFPFSIRIVRDETGTNTRNDDLDEVAILPPHTHTHTLLNISVRVGGAMNGSGR